MRTPPLRRQIETLLTYWRPIMGLDGWMIDVTYAETKLLGFCKAKPSYHSAVIGFNLARIRKELRTPEKVEELVVHELTHCLAWRESERDVSQIAHSLLRASGRRLP